MSVIWIDIWNSEKGFKNKILINHLFKLLYILEWSSVTIVGTGDILHMFVTFKVLNVRNVVVFIDLRTTDCWLDVTRLITSLTFLRRQLQLVYLVLILLSI